MKYGFVRVASAVPSVKVANCDYNAEHIIGLIKKAEEQAVEIVCFPELCITGYTCADLFESTELLRNAEAALQKILDATKTCKVITMVGMPVIISGYLANCAIIIHQGKIEGVVPKTYLPNYKEFYEKRWFASSKELSYKKITLCGQNPDVNDNIIFETPFVKFGVEVCEDLWAPIPCSSNLALRGAEIIFNLSADNDCVGKYDYISSLIKSHSAQTLSGYVFASCGYGESTQDVVFSGNAFICENGKMLAQSHSFTRDEKLVVNEIDVEMLRHERRINTTFRKCASINAGSPEFAVKFIDESGRNDEKLTRKINPLPFVPSSNNYDSYCEDITSIQAMGLAKRLEHIHAKTAVVGISGGLDSTLALLVTAKAFDFIGVSRKNIIGVTMPGFGTSGQTYQNAINLIKETGVTMREISIKDACVQHFKDIEHDISVLDTTYENSQARERTQILMDIANQTGGIVIGTGDLSELALGWATYNGDHMSMYGVNCSIPKTLIRHLIKWMAVRTPNKAEQNTLESIIATPISPELIPTNDKGEIVQKTEDKIGPYELHDFFLYYTLRYGFGPAKIYFLAQQAFSSKEGPHYHDDTIKHWLKEFFRRFFQQQFKRSCLPDGPKVGSCSLSPRGDWRMPSDADSAEWLRECERL